MGTMPTTFPWCPKGNYWALWACALTFARFAIAYFVQNGDASAVAHKTNYFILLETRFPHKTFATHLPLALSFVGVYFLHCPFDPTPVHGPYTIFRFLTEQTSSEKRFIICGRIQLQLHARSYLIIHSWEMLTRNHRPLSFGDVPLQHGDVLRIISCRELFWFWISIFA